MHISAAHSRRYGFSKWWEAHPPGNDNDEPGGATPIAIATPPGDDREAMEEPHRRRLAPGIGAVVLNSSGGDCIALRRRTRAVGQSTGRRVGFVR